MQERLLKPSNPWSVLTFPGEHVKLIEGGASSVSRVVQDDTHLPLADNFILKDLKNNIREMAYILIGEHP